MTAVRPTGRAAGGRSFSGCRNELLARGYWGLEAHRRAVSQRTVQDVAEVKNPESEAVQRESEEEWS